MQIFTCVSSVIAANTRFRCTKNETKECTADIHIASLESHRESGLEPTSARNKILLKATRSVHFQICRKKRCFFTDPKTTHWKELSSCSFLRLPKRKILFCPLPLTSLFSFSMEMRVAVLKFDVELESGFGALRRVRTRNSYSDKPPQI